jgi:dTMP kinase
MLSRGRFITLEGGEGVGKTTNLKFIKDFLQSHQIPLLVTREPGGTELAEKIRGLLIDVESEPVSVKTELLLIFAARAQHIKQLIEPALASGQWVLCDRFTDATYAYQGGGRNLDFADIAWLENWVQAELRPDLTLLLDAPVEVGMRRAKNRGSLDRFEIEKLHFFEQVRDAYMKQAASHPARIKIISADQSLPDVHQALLSQLSPLIDMHARQVGAKNAT